MTGRYSAVCVCVVRGHGPGGCGVCNETGRVETDDFSRLTHEELAGMIDRLEADRETLRERAEGAEAGLRGVWSNLTPALERGGFVTFELADEPSIDERRALSSSIQPLVQELGLRVVVIGPNMKARASHRCESCGKAKR